MTAGYAIRPVSVADAPVIADHRRAMFFDMGHRDRAVLDAMSGHFIPWLIPRLQTGEYLGWFATSYESVAAGIGLWLMDWPPHLIGPGIRRANIINVYTASDTAVAAWPALSCSLP